MSTADKSCEFLFINPSNELKKLSTDHLVSMVRYDADDLKSLLVAELLSRDLAKELGVDPKTNKSVFVKVGKHGAFVQLGTRHDEEKPRFAPLREKQTIGTITLEEALELLSLPRTLGEENGQDIQANEGRFGPYVQVGKEYFSIKKAEKDPYTITLEEAKEIIALGREEKANKIIRTFKEEGIQILHGPYGPYITDGKKNARLPKNEVQPENYTLAQCLELLKTAKPSRRNSSKTNFSNRKGKKGNRSRQNMTKQYRPKVVTEKLVMPNKPEDDNTKQQINILQHTPSVADFSEIKTEDVPF